MHCIALYYIATTYRQTDRELMFCYVHVRQYYKRTKLGVHVCKTTLHWTLSKKTQLLQRQGQQN